MSEVQAAPSGAIWIGCDHGGCELKQHVKAWMKERSIPFHDAGCDSSEIVRYPYYAAQVAEAVVRGEASRGILICSTGIGMSIVANKYRGIRAALCTNTYLSRMTRSHNDSNVLCLGGKVTGPFEALAPRYFAQTDQRGRTGARSARYLESRRSHANRNRELSKLIKAATQRYSYENKHPPDSLTRPESAFE